MVIKQYEVYWIDLEPSVGSEPKKIRPCVIVSPDEMNRHLNTVVVCPLTSTLKGYKCRVAAIVAGKKGEIMLDHLRGLDKGRLKTKLGALRSLDIFQLKSRIKEMFVD
jgi:mRNA interferase MazF